MDLRLMEALPTPAERDAVDRVLGPPESFWQGGTRAVHDAHVARGGRAAREQRHFLLPTLHALQSEIGWISQGGLNYACQRLTVPPAEAYGVASFYGLFSTTPRPPSVAHVCDDIACLPNGAEALCRDLETALGPEGDSWVRSHCLGLCDRPPGVFLQRAGLENLPLPGSDVETVTRLLSGGGESRQGSIPESRQPGLRLLRRVGLVDPESLEEYRAFGGYRALPKAIEMRAAAVIDEVERSRLLGRGGAAFPAGVKWRAVANADPGTRFVICNADESEPGTFKDRVLLEGDPFAIVEAMTIAGLTVGAERGYLYVRGEYPRAADLVRSAIVQAKRAGLLGTDLLGSGRTFEVEVRKGAGAYICGEETALMNSLEGFRGEPRSKPPFPTEVGLFGQPTLVNNVETLACVLDIVEHGGQAFAETGTEGSTGTKLFCVTGSVRTPGVYEVPFGTTVGQLIEGAGGLEVDRVVQTVLVGGAAGSFIPPSRLDLPLTFEDARAAGLSLGSGAVIVYDDTVDVRSIVLRIAGFFRDESCGQCVPCRVGTVRQEEALVRLLAGSPTERPLLDDVAAVMTDASICGLGQTAAVAIQSALRLGLLDPA